MKPSVCYSFHDLGDPAETAGKPDDNPWVVIICPKCDDHLTASRGQYEGRVSFHHDVAYCGYHETHDLRGRRPSTLPCDMMRLRAPRAAGRPPADSAPRDDSDQPRRSTSRRP